MANEDFFNNVQAYGHWKKELQSTIEKFQDWLESTGLEDSDQSLKIYETLQTLKYDHITLAFVGEFSRGKTELINAIFFAKYKRRLLASEAGRTTMCPTELFYDVDEPKPYMRLLPIESRLEDTSITEHKQQPSNWSTIQLDINSAKKMADSFAQITKIKQVKASEAKRLGLYDIVTDLNGTEVCDDKIVEIPVWRHALINFPHPFLKQGLNILDTPGLNSLGNEPELTISMLPNAQAAIFVLAADTGVTRSDMDIWRRHLKSFRRNRNNGLIVALNKIDTLWDDLKTDKEISASIQRQCLESSKTLGIDSKHVFAVSAQKGLLGRIREDEELVEKSNLTLLETILAQDILPQKQSLVRNTIINDIVDLMKNSRIILFGQFNARKKSLASFGGMSGKNENIILELLQQTREEQKNYQINAENLHASRKILLGERKKLNNIISLEKLDKHISKSRTMMKGSWTTNGMKSSMKLLFDGLTNTITEADKQVELTNRLINSIYTRFKKENEDIGVNLEPKLFSINSYKQEIELLYADAEEYRTSVYSTLKEQSFVIKKFFISLVSRARNIYYQLNHDSDHWAKTTLTPLVHQVKAHKQELQTRMLQLKKAGDSRDSITEQVTTITREAKILQKQLIELNAMINIVSAPILVNNIQPEQSTTTK